MTLNNEQNFFCLKDRLAGNYGLYNGMMGLCIASFQLFKVSNVEAWRNIGIELLKEIENNIETIENQDFDCGWLGIGWGIEHLSQNAFIQIDTNEVLEQFDDEIFNAIVFTKSPDISLGKGTMGRCLYLYKRLIARNQAPIRYRQICLLETLVLAMDELCDYFRIDEESLFMLISEKEGINHLSQCIVLMTKVLSAKINTTKVRSLLLKLLKYLSILSREEENILNLTYLPLWQSYHFAIERLGSRLDFLCSKEKLDRIKEFDIDGADVKAWNNDIYILLNSIQDKNGQVDNSTWREAWLKTTDF